MDTLGSKGMARGLRELARRRLVLVVLAVQLAVGCAQRLVALMAESDGGSDSLAAIPFSTVARHGCPSATFAVNSQSDWAALTSAHPLHTWPTIDFSLEMVVGVRITTGSMPGNVQIGSIEAVADKLVIRYCECHSPFAATALSSACHVVRLEQQAAAPTFERVGYDKSWCDLCWNDPVAKCD